MRCHKNMTALLQGGQAKLDLELRPNSTGYLKLTSEQLIKVIHVCACKHRTTTLNQQMRRCLINTMQCSDCTLKHTLTPTLTHHLCGPYASCGIAASKTQKTKTCLLTPHVHQTYVDPTQAMCSWHETTIKPCLLTRTLTPHLRGPYADPSPMLICYVCGGAPFVFPDKGLWANKHVGASMCLRTVSWPREKAIVLVIKTRDVIYDFVGATRNSDTGKSTSPNNIQRPANDARQDVNHLAHGGSQIDRRAWARNICMHDKHCKRSPPMRAPTLRAASEQMLLRTCAYARPF